jgi:glycosyltransferase involved in cell wall biosynthesis
MKTLISIIIPVFNREALIKIALNSVMQQTYADWECIVVDDGSSDGTIEVLKDYAAQDSRISFLERLREPKGAPTCRNISLDHAKGNYVIYLDSDDYLLPFCLEQRVQTINENKDCDFLVFPMGKQKEDTIIKVEIPSYDDYLVPFLSANLPWSIMCPIWKVYFLQTIDGFTEGYPRFNDPELMIRALLQPQAKFKVFNDVDYDTVYMPSAKEPNIFTDKVYESLMLFIPDIVGYLEFQGYADLKKHLALYLHLWFKYIYIPSGESDVWKSQKLIRMFNAHGIISFTKSISLTIRLFLFSISDSLLSKPINKMADKSTYLG